MSSRLKTIGWMFAVVLAVAAQAEARGPGVTVEVVLEADEVNAGEVLKVGAIVTNNSDRDQFVIVEGFLSPLEEPIGIPPVSKWEKFVYQLLKKISGDCELLFVAAGETGPPATLAFVQRLASLLPGRRLKILSTIRLLFRAAAT